MSVNIRDALHSRLGAFSAVIQAEHERFILWAPVCIAIGVGAYFGLRAEPGIYAVLGGLAGAIALRFAVSGRGIAFFTAMAILLAAIGFTAAKMRTLAVDAPRITHKTFADVTGYVTNLDRLPDGGARLWLRVEDISASGDNRRDSEMPHMVRLKMRASDTWPQIGHRVTLRAVLQPIGAPVMPGGFDFQRYAYFKKIGATGYAITDPQVLPYGENDMTPHQSMFEQGRQSLSDMIRTYIVDPDIASVSIAFVTGERLAISESLWDDIRVAGIAHLLAISGFNVGITALVIFIFVRAVLAAIFPLSVRHDVKKPAAITAMVAAVAYTLFIGAPLPAVRAMIMSIIALFAIVIDRDPLSMRLAAVCAAVMLIFEPESLLNASFHLSFAAVIGLIGFYDMTREFWMRSLQRGFFMKAGFYLVGCLATTFVATVMTAPYTLFHFQTVPLAAGLLANMIAVPIAAFIIMPATLLLYLVAAVGMDGGWIIWVIGQGVDLIVAVARNLAHSPYFPSYTGPAQSLWPIVFITFGFLWFFIWHARHRYYGAAVLFMCAAVAAMMHHAPHVLVSENGKTFAVKTTDDDRSWFFSGSSRFVKDVWMERLAIAQADMRVLPKDGETGENAACDSSMCIFGGKVIIINDAMRFFEACHLSEGPILAPRLPKPPVDDCRDAMILDDAYLTKNGATAIYRVHNSHWRMLSVRDDRGLRPWTVYGVSAE